MEKREVKKKKGCQPNLESKWEGKDKNERRLHVHRRQRLQEYQEEKGYECRVFDSPAREAGTDLKSGGREAWKRWRKETEINLCNKWRV